MRPVILLPVAVLFLTSCGAIRPLPALAYRVCPADPAEWTVMSTPPRNAAELVAAATRDLAPSGYGREPRLFWFQGRSETLLLCRTVVDPHALDACGASAWHFDRVGGEWVPRGTLDLVVVCG